MQPRNGFTALWRALCDVCEWVSRVIVGGSLAAIVVITVVAVWYRYGLNNPLSWTEQVCRILFVWSVFAGATVLYRQMLHIAIDMFVLMLPQRFQTAIFWVNQALMLLIAVMMLWFGLQISIGTLGQTFGALEITPAWFYFAAPFCGALIILFWIEKLFDPQKRDPTGEVHL
ncbi:TRAP transporter small permease [Bosea sp. 124]|uniref:TRAP transporter small permease n=1 Tax=Bosea sp. 124 TaxID=2135642 RepID=UPI000D408AEE|nr:TRAP transporter small permease [Bosea sp. 124]PTM40976.1 TRAP-type C4-dicarboxylate transport system permease small subunit [Bosea sp. 124]